MTQQIIGTEGDDYEPSEETPGPPPSWAALKRAFDALQAAYDALLEKNKKLRFRLQTIRGITTDDDDE